MINAKTYPFCGDMVATDGINIAIATTTSEAIAQLLTKSNPCGLENRKKSLQNNRFATIY